MPPPPVGMQSNPQVPLPNVDSILVYIPMEEFNNFSSDDQKKQYLGDHLYQYVKRKIENDVKAKQLSQKITSDKVQHLASRITGMIIEGQSIDFLLYICNSRNAFNSIVNEAQTLLE